MLPKNKMTDKEMRKWIWANVFMKSIERSLEHGEWRGIEASKAGEIANEAIEQWELANKEV